MREDFMKILFINPSLRRGAKTKLLPVGIGYIMTYVHENGYDFDLLDVDIDDLSDEEVETYIRKNKYDVVLSGCIVTKLIASLRSTIPTHSLLRG